MDGAIIDIKRFTLHDGSGIRSTLFLKGCSLQCAWCQNPEGLEVGINLWYLQNQCIRCRTCIAVCPVGALRVDEENDPFIRIDRTVCTSCGRCVSSCPTTALSFDGRIISADDAAAFLLRDIEFYRQSGGGVTISGGDPLVQHEFALEVLRLCREGGVHTAIETCLNGDFAILERFIPRTDLFIVDLKLADDALHREYTRRSNDLIRQNYRDLARRGVSLLTRIPLIPRVTATESNITALARFIREENPGGQVELINYNPLAENKYHLMNKSTEFFAGMAPLPERELGAFQAILLSEGLAVVNEHKRSGAPGR
ncbi:MAG TPA: glycyl-radical enzyme activating protein [Rectinemataceae bacterium]|nr:glycyl-radical enzyme activating protein [Rectinemataceae bacterium]